VRPAGLRKTLPTLTSRIPWRRRENHFTNGYSHERRVGPGPWPARVVVFAPSRPSCVCCCCCCLLSQQQPQPARSPRDRRSTLSSRGRTAAASTQRGCWARRSDLQREPPVPFSHSTVTSKSRQPVRRPPRRASLAPTAQRPLPSPRLPSHPPSHPPSQRSWARRHGRPCLCCNLLQAQVVGLSEDVEQIPNLPTSLTAARPPARPPAGPSPLQPHLLQQASTFK